MPGVSPPNNEQYYADLGRLFQRVRALETQQQSTITNQLGQPVLNFGLVPGSNPAQFGMQFVDPASGTVRMFIGENQGTGATSVQFFDASGDVRIQIDAAGFHQYDASGNQILLLGTQSNGNDGLGVYNGATLEMMAGLINTSPAIYGLGVLPHGGSQLQQVGGSLSSGSLSVSGVNTNYVQTTFPGASTITAVVGPSGSVMIGGSFQIDTIGSGTTASATVSIDSGASFVEVAALNIVSGQGTVLGGSTFQWNGLTPGTHTFTAVYSTGSTGTADLYGNIYVQPL